VVGTTVDLRGEDGKAIGFSREERKDILDRRKALERQNQQILNLQS
jgi:hypothetical protein